MVDSNGQSHWDANPPPHFFSLYDLGQDHHGKSVFHIIMNKSTGSKIRKKVEKKIDGIPRTIREFENDREDDEYIYG